MARGSLASDAVLKLLQPFVITSANCGGSDLSALDPEVRDIFTKSDLFKDPERLNVFAFVLDHNGQLVHQFHGLPGGRGRARSDYAVELARAIARLKLPEEQRAKKNTDLPGLPDLPKSASGTPAGVRLFLRQETSRLPLVEVVSMKADQWQPLALPTGAKDVDAELLKDWLVWLYPAAIRAVDEAKRFQTFSGKLKLEPAGADKDGRYAVLRGEVRLAKGNDKESAFEGKLQLVLTYGSEATGVRSVRGVVEGDYIYRMGGTQRIAMQAAIESRPE
jgi:hypothetical protein